LKILVWKQA